MPLLHSPAQLGKPFKHLAQMCMNLAFEMTGVNMLKFRATGVVLEPLFMDRFCFLPGLESHYCTLSSSAYSCWHDSLGVLWLSKDYTFTCPNGKIPRLYVHDQLNNSVEVEIFFIHTGALGHKDWNP